MKKLRLGAALAALFSITPAFGANGLPLRNHPSRARTRGKRRQALWQSRGRAAVGIRSDPDGAMDVVSLERLRLHQFQTRPDRRELRHRHLRLRTAVRQQRPQLPFLEPACSRTHGFSLQGSAVRGLRSRSPPLRRLWPHQRRSWRVKLHLDRNSIHSLLSRWLGAGRGARPVTPHDVLAKPVGDDRNRRRDRRRHRRADLEAFAFDRINDAA